VKPPLALIIFLKKKTFLKRFFPGELTAEKPIRTGTVQNPAVTLHQRSETRWSVTARKSLD
jgi:hypothetical protein